MEIEITGTTIVGFAIFGGNTGQGVCRVSGSIDADGAIQNLYLDCPQGGRWSFSGRFTVAEGGMGETVARNAMVGTFPVTWKKRGS